MKRPASKERVGGSNSGISHFHYLQVWYYQWSALGYLWSDCGHDRWWSGFWEGYINLYGLVLDHTDHYSLPSEGSPEAGFAVLKWGCIHAEELGKSHFFMVTLVVAILFSPPIFFHLMSGFKSNTESMKDAIAFSKTLHLDSFKYLLTEIEYQFCQRNT